MNVHALARISAAALTATACSVALATPATADPLPPASRPWVGVGSSATEDVWNGLTNGYTKGGVSVSPQAPTVGSYDSLSYYSDINLIRTRAGRPVFQRPGDLFDTTRALSAALQGIVYRDVRMLPNDVNFARSSFGPRANEFPGTQLTFVPFAREAVSVVVNTGNRRLASIRTTRAELIKMYSANKAQYPTCTFPVHVRSAEGTVSVYFVIPWLPAHNSEMRSAFLEATLGRGVQPGDCTRQTHGRQNDGRFIAPGAIMPFSVSQWIRQRNGVTARSAVPAIGNTTSPYEAIADIDGLTATSGYGTKLTPGTVFGDPAAKPPSGGYARDMYVVMPTWAATKTNNLYMTLRNASQARNGLTPVVIDFGFLKLSPSYIDSFTASSSAKQGYTWW